VTYYYNKKTGVSVWEKPPEREAFEKRYREWQAKQRNS
jgi:hypothetical protein